MEKQFEQLATIISKKHTPLPRMYGKPLSELIAISQTPCTCTTSGVLPCDACWAQMLIDKYKEK